MYPFYLMISFLGCSAVISGLTSLIWSRSNVLNQIIKAILMIISVFSGVGFYATLVNDYWMWFNAFSLVSGIAYIILASITRGPLYRFLFWILGISGTANAVIAFTS